MHREPHSYGYHGDDGHRFSGSGVGTPYGPTYTTGDVVGIIFNCANRTIAYTKNGIDLGVAFSNVQEERLYPTIGMRTPNEEVVVRFAPPFKHDIGHHVQEAVAKAVDLVRNTSLLLKPKQVRCCIIVRCTPLRVCPQSSASLLGELIYQHLLQEGHTNTAAAVNRDLLGGAHEVCTSMCMLHVFMYVLGVHAVVTCL